MGKPLREGDEVIIRGKVRAGSPLLIRVAKGERTLAYHVGLRGRLDGAPTRLRVKRAGGALQLNSVGTQGEPTGVRKWRARWAFPSFG